MGNRGRRKSKRSVHASEGAGIGSFAARNTYYGIFVAVRTWQERSGEFYFFQKSPKLHVNNTPPYYEWYCKKKGNKSGFLGAEKVKSIVTWILLFIERVRDRFSI